MGLTSKKRMRWCHGTTEVTSLSHFVEPAISWLCNPWFSYVCTWIDDCSTSFSSCWTTWFWDQIMCFIPSVSCFSSSNAPSCTLNLSRKIDSISLMHFTSVSLLLFVSQREVHFFVLRVDLHHSLCQYFKLCR